MAQCEIDGRQLFLYLDGELCGRELTVFESHLSDCAWCRLALAGRRQFLEQVAQARPPLSAPATLRARIEDILAGAPAPISSLSPAARVPGFMERVLSALPTFRWVMPRAAFALVLLVSILGGVWLDRQNGHRPRSAFAAAALEAHKSRLHGELPLAIHSSSPEVIAAWFHGRVPVNVKLPPSEDLSQQPSQIEGAGLTPFQGGKLAYIAYRVGTQQVSLLVAPVSAVTLDGRRQVAMKSLVFHYDSADGFHIVTWAVPRKGVTYALVSDHSQHANQSCIICHASPKDRAFMRSLVSQ